MSASPRRRAPRLALALPTLALPTLALPTLALPTLALLTLALLTLALLPVIAGGQLRRPAAPVSVVETSLADLRTALEQQRVTSRELVRQYLARIGTYDVRLRATITVNPRALAIADSLDRLRAQGRILGPLHGIPIALKDNIHDVTMPTTGGALAFADLMVPHDATLTTQLKAAGAIILAKTQLTELANWTASGMPANYNGLNGYGMNPWDSRRDPRDATFDGRPVLTTGGSSSGTGTNVSFWAANVGTETSGSILSPSMQNFLVGIKPTVGRISRYGVIPITADQDTPGPMARTVRDAAILLGAMETAVPDPNDPATKACPPPAGRDYTAFLDTTRLEGARIGIPRAFFYDTAPPVPGVRFRGGLGRAQRAAMDSAIAVLAARGAVIVDPADLPSVRDTAAGRNVLAWNPCSGLEQAKGRDADCSVVLKYGMKRDFNAWLASLGDRAPVASLTALRQWNITHQRAGAIKYGQALLDISDEMDVQQDRARYEADRRKDVALAGTYGIDAAMQAHRLDALLFPAVASAGVASRPGYPSVTVPWTFVPAGDGAAGFPKGFDPKPAPYNVTFTGLACSEPVLIGIAYAFEQATRRRVAPPQFP